MAFLQRVLIVILLGGCSTSETVQLAEAPEPIAQTSSSDTVALPAEMASPPTASDMEEASRGGATVDEQSAPSDSVDFLFDVPFEQPPSPSEYAILNSGDTTWVTYWRGGRLWSRRGQAIIEPPEENTIPVFGAIDTERVDLVFEPQQLVAYVRPFDGEILGARVPEVNPDAAAWVAIPDGESGRLRAYDVSQRNTNPVDLDLYPPARVLGVRDNGDLSAGVLVVGAMSDTPGAQLGFRYLTSASPSSLNVLGRVSADFLDFTISDSKWIFAFEDGTCLVTVADLSATPEELGVWRCHGRSGARFVGRGPLSGGQPGPWLIAQRGAELVMLETRPGLTQDPWPQTHEVTLGGQMSGGPTTGGEMAGGSDDSEFGGGQAAGAMGGRNDVGGMDMASDAGGAGETAGGEETAGAGETAGADHAGSHVAGASSEGQHEGGEDRAGTDLAGGTNQPVFDSDHDPATILRHSAVLVGVTNALDDGLVARVREGESESLFILRERMTQRTALEEPAMALGAVNGAGDTIFLVNWDPDAGQPTAIKVMAELDVDPPGGLSPLCVNRLPESCAGSDLDCDGDFTNGLCCPASSTDWTEITMPSASLPLAPWAVAPTDENGIGAFAYGDRLELVSFSDGEVDCRACWNGPHRIKQFNHQGAVSVILTAVPRGTELNMLASDGCPEYCSCGGLCNRCLIDNAPEALLEATEGGQFARCANHEDFTMNWCSANPDACEALRNGTCAVACGVTDLETPTADEMATGGMSGSDDESNSMGSGGTVGPGGAHASGGEHGSEGAGGESADTDEVRPDDSEQEKQHILIRLERDMRFVIDEPCPFVHWIHVWSKSPSHRIVLFCDDEMLTYDFADETTALAAETTAYEGGSLQWVGPAIYPEGVDGPAVLLVAMGPDYNLRLLRLDEAVTELPLPQMVSHFAPAERQLPIRMPIGAAALPARQISATQIEVYRPGLGWRSAPTPSYSLDVQLSQYDDVAISVVASSDPSDETVSASQRTLSIYAHSLEANVTNWGRSIELQSSIMRQSAVHGVHFAQWQERLAPNLWWATGSPPTLKARFLSCEHPE